MTGGQQALAHLARALLLRAARRGGSGGPAEPLRRGLAPAAPRPRAASASASARAELAAGREAEAEAEGEAAAPGPGPRAEPGPAAGHGPAARPHPGRGGREAAAANAGPRGAAAAAAGAAGAAKWRRPRDLGQYKGLLRRLHQQRLAELSRDLYSEMLLDGVLPDHEMFNHLVAGALNSHNPQDALFYFEQMQGMGMQPGIATYTCAIRALAACRDPRRAFLLAEQMRTAGIAPDGMLYSALMSACATVGDVAGAQGLVKEFDFLDLPLDRYFLPGLLVAMKNQNPKPKDAAEQIVAQMAALADRVREDPRVSKQQRADFTMELFNAALGCAVELRGYAAAEAVVAQLEGHGLRKDTAMYAHLLRGEMQRLRDTHKELHIERVFDLVNEMKMAGEAVPVFTIVLGISWCLDRRKASPKRVELVQCLLEEKRRSNTYFTKRDGTKLLQLATRRRWGEPTVAAMLWQTMRQDGHMPSRYILKSLHDCLEPEEAPELAALAREVGALLKLKKRDLRARGPEAAPGAEAEDGSSSSSSSSSSESESSGGESDSDSDSD